jgi:hypothetical protein
MQIPAIWTFSSVARIGTIFTIRTVFWYLQWSEHRFELVEQGCPLGAFLAEQQNLGRSLDELNQQPRAVGQLRVVLRSRLLCDEERRTMPWHGHRA